jgi:hypothetical protein
MVLIPPSEMSENQIHKLGTPHPIGYLRWPLPTPLGRLSPLQVIGTSCFLTSQHPPWCQAGLDCSPGRSSLPEKFPRPRLLSGHRVNPSCSPCISQCSSQRCLGSQLRGKSAMIFKFPRPYPPVGPFSPIALRLNNPIPYSSKFHFVRGRVSWHLNLSYKRSAREGQTDSSNNALPLIR